MNVSAWSLGSGSLDSKENKQKPDDRGVIVIPDGIVPGSNTWCGKAAKAAKQDCSLMEETQRMFLATLVTNCHLESTKRDVVQWDPKHALKYAPVDDVYLVVMVSGQLETLCQKFGVTWAHALATEQGERFKDIHAELKRIQEAAKEMTKSGTDTVDAVKGVEGMQERLLEVQQSVTEQAKRMESLSGSISKDMVTVRSAGTLAFETQRATEAAIKEFGASLSETLKDLPAASDAFARNSERLDRMMSEYTQTAPVQQESPATASSVMLIAFVVCLGFLFTDRASRLLGITLVVAILKIIVASSPGSSSDLWGQSWTELFNPVNYAWFLAYQVLGIVPYQSLFLVATLAVLWETAPSVVRSNFLGDRTILAKARLESADLLASNWQATESIRNLENDLRETKQRERKLRVEGDAHAANVATKDDIIKDLEVQVRKSRNLRRDAANAVSSIQEQTRQANEFIEQQKETIHQLEQEIDEFRNAQAEQNTDITDLQNRYLALQARESNANKKLAESIENRQRLANMLESKLQQNQNGRADSNEVLNEEHHNMVSSLENEIESLSGQIAEQEKITAKLRHENEKLKTKATETATHIGRLVERESKATLELFNLKRKLAREAKPKVAPVRSKSFRRTSSAVQKDVALDLDDDYGGVHVNDDDEAGSSEEEKENEAESVPARNTRSAKKAPAPKGSALQPATGEENIRPSGILGLFSDGDAATEQPAPSNPILGLFSDGDGTTEPSTPSQIRASPPRLEPSKAHGSTRGARLSKPKRKH